MRVTIFAAVSILLGGPGLAQQPVPPPAMTIAAPAATLPPGTAIKLRVDKEVTSKTAKVGDRFDLSVAEDVRFGHALAIPAGTRAVAEITERTGRGAMGKSAKMRIEFRTITINGRDYVIGGDGRNKGKKNTAAQVGMFLLFGPFAGAVSGRSAKFKQGEILQGVTVDPIPVTVEG